MKRETKQIIRDIISEENSEAFLIESYFDDALIGTARMCGGRVVAAYDASRCIEILMKKFSLGDLEAFEQFQNTIEVYDGEDRPVFVSDFRKISTAPTEISDTSTTIAELLRFPNS